MDIHLCKVNKIMKYEDVEKCWVKKACYDGAKVIPVAGEEIHTFPQDLYNLQSWLEVLRGQLFKISDFISAYGEWQRVYLNTHTVLEGEEWKAQPLQILTKSLIFLSETNKQKKKLQV